MMMQTQPASLAQYLFRICDALLIRYRMFFSREPQAIRD